MLYGNIHFTEDIEQLNAFNKRALKLIKQYRDMPEGSYDIGNKEKVIVQEGKTLPIQFVLFEAHQKYIDIQYMVCGNEIIEWSDISNLEVEIEYDSDKDLTRLKGKGKKKRITSGSYYIFCPEDAHKACCHRYFPTEYKKVVIKLLKTF